MVERGAHLRVLGWPRVALVCASLVLSTLLAPAVADAAPERRVLFLVDRSGSMSWAKDPATGQPRAFSFTQAMEGARRRARDLLAGHRGRDDVRVSFWQLGDKDQHAPIGGAVGLLPDEAASRVDAAFSDDARLYNAPKSYISYSIFQVIKTELELGAEFTTDKDIPDDASLFDICVVTDGEEEVRRGFDNRPYVEWVERQQRRLRLRWDRCDVYVPPPPEICTGGIDEDRDGRADCDDPDCADHPACTTPPPDHVVYDVLFGLPTLAAVYDPTKPPEGHKVELEVPRTLRLVARGHGAGLRSDEAASLLVCRGEPADPAPSPRSTLAVQAEVRWDVRVGTTRTAEWSITAPPRRVEGERKTLRFERGSLRPRIEGATTAVLPAGDVPEGAAPVRLVHDALCAELKRAWPGSSFVLPQDDDGGLLRLGDVSVKVYVPPPPPPPPCLYTVVGGDSMRPDAPLGPLRADWLHVYEQASRRLGVSCDERCGPATIPTRVTLTDETGKDVADAARIIAVPGGPRSGVIDLACGGDLHVVSPAERQDHWERAFGLGFDPPPGSYVARACFRPELAAPPMPARPVLVRCPDCVPPAASAGEHCVEIPLVIESPPLFWLWWVAIGIAGVLLLVLAVLWATRPQLPPGLFIGTSTDNRDLRTAHGAGLKGAWALIRRQPLFVHLQAGGFTQATREAFTGSDLARGMPVLGVLPGSMPGTFRLWDATLPAGEGELDREASLDGDTDPLPRLRRPSRRRIQREARVITLDEARHGGRSIMLRELQGGSVVDTTAYPIRVEEH